MSVPAPPSSTRPRRSTQVIVVTVAMVLVVVLVGASLVTWAAVSFFGGDDDGPDATPPAPSATVEMPAAPSGLEEFYDQELDWRNCDDNECTTLQVPLDYAEPDGEVIELAVVRVPAARRGQRVGQLVVNPGGPGGSGVKYATSGSLAFGASLSRYFDIVGFDPRGVGKSTPLECADTEQTDEFLGFDPDPDTPAEVAEQDRLTREFGQGCLDRSGDLARHISTVEAAKDIDVLRAALGERQLDYFGASYGTLLGATYADLFPTHVRRMVLDGAVDPSLSGQELNLQQARGFQRALDAYLEFCIGQGECVLGDSVEQGRARIQQLLDELDEKPLPTSSGRELNEAQAYFGLALPLYVKSYWPLLSAALQEAIEDGRGDKLLTLADQYNSRGPDGYTDNSSAALYAVNCLDHDDAIPSSEVPALFPEFEKAAPSFARWFAWDMSTCASWPIRSGSRTQALDAPGAPPILVIGTTRDPATPYEWSEALAGQLESGRLISRDGDGHTGFQQGNKCVDGAVDSFFVAGKVPRDGLSC